MTTPVKPEALVAVVTALRRRVTCAQCPEHRPATCVGAYEDPEHPVAPACDTCCGHGNEDGWCVPLEDVLEQLAQLVLSKQPTALDSVELWLSEEHARYLKRVDVALADPQGFANSRWLGGEANALGRVADKVREVRRSYEGAK